MKKRIEGMFFDEESTMPHMDHCEVLDCIFAGSSSESVSLNASHDMLLDNCTFFQSSVLWNCVQWKLNDSRIEENAHAALWYCEEGKITDTDILGPKALWAGNNLIIHGCTIDCAEFGWLCNRISIADTKLTSDYLLLNSRNISLDHVQTKGVSALQYADHVEIRNCFLHTDNALWHSKNVTVTDSVILGEHLGWFSDNLTLIGCKIIGKQPLCHCTNLTLINCTLEEADNAFEYSDVNATIEGHVDSIKNPHSGEIILDSVGKVIVGDAVMECSGKVIVRE